MKKEYDEIMEHIKVTPEMRRRILRHIQEENIPASSSKIVKYPSIPKYLSVAACLVLLLVGALALPRMVNGGDLDPIASSGQGLEEVASRHDLSDLVGFALDDELKLPFHVDDIRFFSYWGNLAEIKYSGAEQSADFRKSLGSEDNSGDYTVYEDVITLDVSGRSVTLKGYDGAYSLAVWTDGTYAYSLRLSHAAAEKQWYEILCP